jgi:hypothetical protein
MVWLLRSVLGRNEDDPSRDRGTTSLAPVAWIPLDHRHRSLQAVTGPPVRFY